uniref:Uncharacterized protein n=1 Tax=Romanomermis culicivorax TaxID=13658 RepID=A0A915JNN6_ROMCU
MFLTVFCSKMTIFYRKIYLYLFRLKRRWFIWLAT